MHNPEWTMNDDGTISISFIQHENALLYTFAATVAAHNNRIFNEQNLGKAAELFTKYTYPEAKEAVAEMRTERDTAQNVQRPTKVSINRILLGSYTTAGITLWWKRPQTRLDGLTPAEVWKTDPQRVADLFR